MSDNMQPIDEILDDESPDAKATEAYEEDEEFDPFEGMSDEELLKLAEGDPNVLEGEITVIEEVPSGLPKT